MLMPNQVVIMLDFKEKLKFTHCLAELQSEHWDNTLQSLLGVIFYLIVNGAVEREYLDIYSDIAVQDSERVCGYQLPHPATPLQQV